jgi:hypothetical protein
MMTAGLMIWGLNPLARDRRFISQICPEQLQGPHRFLFSGSGSWGYLLGIKWMENKADHFPSSSAEVKNQWSCTSHPLIFLYGMQRDNFTIYLQVIV